MQIYDDITYTYKVMDDAPYRLDHVTLRSMQKMERALSFLLNNIKVGAISSEEAATQAGYSEEYFIKAFKEYFGMPFQMFVTKLKLRRAAADIQSNNYPKQIGMEYGFSSVQSFSKAFKHEFGISPRKFYKGNYSIPDMPFRSNVKGLEIKLEYSEEHALSLTGASFLPPRGEDTYFMDAYALPYGVDAQESRVNSQNDKVGIWWYGLNEGMKYVFGDVKHYYDTVYVPDDKVDEGEILIQGGNYAVFSYARPEDDKEIFLLSRIMARYVFKEWVPVNGKVTNTIGYTYEKFTKNRIYLYVPIAIGMGGTEEIKPKKWGIPAWARYIDEHINEQLSLESLAIIAGYSPQNYRDVFTMYYGITPTEYIRRRRLSLNSKATSNGDDSITDDEQLYNIEEYYEKNNAKVKLTTTILSDSMLLLHSIEETEGEELPVDLIGRVLYWFHRDFNDFAIVKDLIESDAKVSIWGDKAVYENGHSIYKYYVGSFLKHDLNSADIDRIKKETGAMLEELSGGRYAVFQTFDRQDEDRPELAYHLLTLTAFGGWINENRWRTDLNRRTFVIWKGHKLYFYVPIVR